MEEMAKKRWIACDGCRDYHEQLGGLCAWYRTEELLAELRYTGFPDAAFGKEVGWWQVGRGAWRLQHRSPRGREAHRGFTYSTLTLGLTFTAASSVCAPGGGGCDRMRSTVG